MFFLCYSVSISYFSLCSTFSAVSFFIFAFALTTGLGGSFLHHNHNHVYATTNDFGTANSSSRVSDSPQSFNSSLVGSNMSNSTLQFNIDQGNSSAANPSTSVGPQTGSLQIPYTGISRHHIAPEDAKLFGLNDTTYAMIITEVEPGSPAAIAGIRGGNMTTNVAGEIVKLGGDMILKIDGNDTYFRTSDAFLNYLQNEKKVGQNMTLTVLRNGQIGEVNMTIGSLPRFLWYNDNDEGIRIKYPSEWEVSGSESVNDIVKFFTPHDVRVGNETEPSAGIFVLISPAGSKGLDDLATTEQRDSSRRRNLGITLTSVSDFPAYESIYYDYSENRTLKKLSTFTIKDGSIYRIELATDPSRYDDYLPLAREVIRSFKFTR
jgi:PDZ domain/PsbP-like protein